MKIRLDPYARIVEAVRHTEAFDELLRPADAGELFLNLARHFIGYSSGIVRAEGEPALLAARGDSARIEEMRERVIPEWISWLEREYRPVVLPISDKEWCLAVPFHFGTRLVGCAGLALESEELSEWQLQVAAILGRAVGSALGRMLQAEELQSERDYARSIFDSIVSAIMVVGPTGLVQEVNDGASSLFDQPALGRHYRDLFDFEREDPIEDCLRTGRAQHHVETRGRSRIWGFTVSPFRIGPSQSGVVAGFRDLTETKKLEELLATTERQATVGRMAATVAHEVNNPLGAIKAQLRLLKKHHDNREKLERGLDIVGIQVDRIARTIQALLGFSRQRRAEHSVVSLEEVISTLIELFEGGFREKGIRVEVDLAPSLPNIRADVDQIQELLVNLLENARDALGTGHIVRISAAERAGVLEIVVEDDGPGLGDHPEMVFDPFYTTKLTGTGLGLTIARKICEAQGGTLQAENRAGGGARFVATIGGEA